MKDIPGYENLYRINIVGDIYSVRYRKYITSTIRSGYKYSNLYKDKQRKNLAIHRLVALTYIPNPDSKPQINHKDGHKLNNAVSNLEWCTPKENSKHSKDTGLWHPNYGESNGNSKITVETVRFIRSSPLRNKDLVKLLDLKSNTISSIRKYKRWAHVT